jgi:hypothetical protein
LALYILSGDDIFTALLLIGLILLLIRGLAWNQVKALLAGGWLTHQGTVEFGSVEERSTRYKNLYIARIGLLLLRQWRILFRLPGASVLHGKLGRQVCRVHERTDGVYPLQPQPSRAFGIVAAGPARWLARLSFKSNTALSRALDSEKSPGAPPFSRFLREGGDFDCTIHVQASA